MPVLAEVHFFPVCIVILCSKLYFPAILLCLCIFYGGKINFRSNTASGKTSQQCEVHGQCKLHQRREHRTGLPPSLLLNTDLPSQRCIPRCPLLTIWLVTFLSTISLHLWPTLHCRACTIICTHGEFPSIHHYVKKCAVPASSPEL